MKSKMSLVLGLAVCLFMTTSCWKDTPASIVKKFWNSAEREEINGLIVPEERMEQKEFEEFFEKAKESIKNQEIIFEEECMVSGSPVAIVVEEVVLHPPKGKKKNVFYEYFFIKEADEWKLFTIDFEDEEQEGWTKNGTWVKHIPGKVRRYLNNNKD